MFKRYFYNLIIFFLTSSSIKTMEQCYPFNQALEYTVLSTGVGTIQDFKYNHDGSKIVAMGNNCSFAEVWDVNNNRLFCTLKDTAPITSVNFHPTIDLVITSHQNYQLKLWDISSGECIASTDLTLFNKDNSFANPIISYASYRDSNNMAWVSSDNRKQILRFYSRPKNQDELPFLFEYNLEDSEQLESISSYNNSYLFLRLKNNAMQNQTCKIFKIDSNNEVKELANLPIYDYCSATNSCLMAIDKKTLSEYSFCAQKLEHLASLYAFNSDIKSAQYNPDGNKALITTENGSITVLERQIHDKNSWSWQFAYSMPADFDVVLNPVNSYRFASKSLNNNLIALFQLS